MTDLYRRPVRPRPSSSPLSSIVDQEVQEPPERLGDRVARAGRRLIHAAEEIQAAAEAIPFGLHRAAAGHLLRAMKAAADAVHDEAVAVGVALERGAAPGLSSAVRGRFLDDLGMLDADAAAFARRLATLLDNLDAPV